MLLTLSANTVQRRASDLQVPPSSLNKPQKQTHYTHLRVCQCLPQHNLAQQAHNE